MCLHRGHTMNTGGASLGAGGPWPPLANENSHYVNSKMTTVHYCSKRVAPPHLSKIQGQAPPLPGKIPVAAVAPPREGLRRAVLPRNRRPATPRLSAVGSPRCSPLGRSSWSFSTLDSNREREKVRGKEGHGRRITWARAHHVATAPLADGQSRP